MSSYALKYTFEVVFNDGSIYTQDPSDSPKIASQGSAFTDIKDRLEDIKTFSLYLQGDLFALVDLTDGHFELQGISFKSQNPSVTLPKDIQYRLIYFRRVTHKGSGGDLHLDSVEYHIGWQATVDEKNYQQTIAVE